MDNPAPSGLEEVPVVPPRPGSAPSGTCPPRRRIHRTAIVSKKACLAADVRVGPYAVIEAHTRLGEGTEVRSHAAIKQFTTLGPRNVVHEGAVLGGEPQDRNFLEGITYLRIGADNRIREGVTIHRGTTPQSTTVVGSGCFLMAYAHIGHNCQIGDHVILGNNVLLAGFVEVEDGAFLSGGVGVHQFCRIGQLAMIGGHSKIVQDCLPYVITDGNPGRAQGVNVVGLRRAGYSNAQILTLRQAYRLLLRSGLSLDAALERLADLDDPLVRNLIAFVRSSTRGFAREEPRACCREDANQPGTE